MKSDFSQLTVALISDVFIYPDDAARLGDSLKHARSRGAELAVLPEIPLNPWSPAIQTANEHDADIPPGVLERVICRRAVCIELLSSSRLSTRQRLL
jgi:predicted amidohydrolase